jgi:hypothetical protein
MMYWLTAIYNGCAFASLVGDRERERKGVRKEERYEWWGFYPIANKREKDLN